jgi:hypothetical protein
MLKPGDRVLVNPFYNTQPQYLNRSYIVVSINGDSAQIESVDDKQNYVVMNWQSGLLLEPSKLEMEI